MQPEELEPDWKSRKTKVSIFPHKGTLALEQVSVPLCFCFLSIVEEALSNKQALLSFFC